MISHETVAKFSTAQSIKIPDERIDISDQKSVVPRRAHKLALQNQSLHEITCQVIDYYYATFQ